MTNQFTKIDVRKLDQQLRLVRIKTVLAIVLGDCRAVARLTCETARLQNAIGLARTVVL
jgi:hypothetical protein